MSSSVNLLKLSIISDGSIGRKSYIPIREVMYPPGQGLKSKKLMKSRSRTLIHGVIVIVGLALSSTAFAQQAQSQEMTTTEQAPKLPSGELDSLVAPIALYPDQLLAQTLA